MGNFLFGVCGKMDTLAPSWMAFLEIICHYVSEDKRRHLTGLGSPHKRSQTYKQQAVYPRLLKASKRHLY
jgi:hypothetical protein